MKRTMTLVLALALATVSNAQWGKTIRGNGDVVTQQRTVGEYRAVSLAGWFDVKLVPGREGTITIQGDSNLLDHIITQVDNGNLELKTEKGYNLSSSQRTGIKITVPVESIQAVNLSGSGNISGSDPIKAPAFSTRLAGSGDIDLIVEADQVETSVSGSGDVTLSGSTGELNISVSGSGDVMAYGLKAKIAKVNVTGSADVEVTATEQLMAWISGSGDIVYRGDPQKVQAKSVGSGSVTKE